MREAATPAECLVDSRCELGESPLWLADGTLCWLDVGNPSTLFEWNLETRSLKRWPLPELTSALAAREHGLLLLCKSGVRAFDRRDGSIRPLAPPPFAMEPLRFNDCGCDAVGRLWTGTMRDNFAPAAVTAATDEFAGELLRYDPDGSVHRILAGIGCPNTFAWSPRGRTLYSADSSTGCLYQFDFEPRSGAASNRRLFCNPADLGVPDGSAVDAEGHIWNARWGAGCVARFAPDGALLQTVSIPARQVTSCAFGGSALDTLFVTTARIGLTPDALAQQPLAGGVFSFRPGVRGLPVRPCRL